MTRVGLVGPGGIGLFFGGHLEAAGRRVEVASRQPFERYVIMSDEYPVDIPAVVYTDPEMSPQGPMDVVLVTVKLHQIASTRPWLQRWCGPKTVVVSLQNGLDGEDLIAAVSPAGVFVPSIMYCAIERLDIGVARHDAQARLILPPGQSSEIIARLYAKTPIDVAIRSSFVTDRWRKLGLNVVSNGLTALTDRSTEVLSTSAIRQVMHDLLQESWAVASACGADLGPGDVQDFIRGLDAMPPDVVPSMLQDRREGRMLEHDGLYGAVRRAGERVGVKTPTVNTVDRLLAGLSGGANGSSTDSTGRS
jgi:2-dehydropantoate 2-reductase